MRFGDWFPPAECRVSSLRQQVEASESEPQRGHIRVSRGDAPFVEFHVTPHVRRDFPVGQLCDYTLESNAADGDEPPERLTLAFPTADVIVSGSPSSSR